MARTSYPNPGELGGEAGALLEAIGEDRGYVPNLYRMLAHSPALLGDFVEMTGHVRDTLSLPAAFRELAILTVAQTARTPTPWLSHLPIARAAGVSGEQILGLTVWERHPTFSDEERAVIRFAEEVTRDVRATDDTWRALSAFLDPRQLVELSFVVGYYNMVARYLVALRIDIDPEYLAAAAGPS